MVVRIPGAENGAASAGRFGIDGRKQTVTAKDKRALVIIGKEFPEITSMVARKALILHSGHTICATAAKVIGSRKFIS